MKNKNNFCYLSIFGLLAISSYANATSPCELNADGEYPATQPQFVEGEVLISNICELRGLSESTSRWSSEIRLVNDIDASNTKLWYDGLGFSPIGFSNQAFTGTFNGDGYKISNLHINNQRLEHVGLFGLVDSANISNLQLTGDIRTTFRKGFVGGLIGKSIGTTNITMSSSEARLTGGDYSVAGGLVGSGSSGFSVSNSFVRAEISVGYGSTIGGVIGSSSGSNPDVTESYAIVSHKWELHTTIKPMIGDSSSISESFYYQNDPKIGKSFGGYSAEDMKKPETYINLLDAWDAKNVWQLINGKTPALIFDESERKNPVFKTPSNESDWQGISHSGKKVLEDSGEITVDLEATAANSGEISFKLIGSDDPELVTLDDDAWGGATLIITPTSNEHQLSSISVMVIEKDMWGGETYNMLPVHKLVVETVNDAPIIDKSIESPFTVTEDKKLVINLQDFISDEESNLSQLSITATTPKFGTTSLSGSSLTYSPNPNHFGRDAFSITLKDGLEHSVGADLLVDVTSVLDVAKPKDRAEIVTLDEDTQSNKVYLKDVVEMVDGVTWSYSFEASNGSVIDSTAEDEPYFIYKPKLNFNGSDTVKVTVIDSTLSSSTLSQEPTVIDVRFNVDSVNDLPEISGKPTLSVNQDSYYEFIPEAVDVETSNSKLVFSIENKPGWAEFDSKTGKLNGVPTNDDTGPSNSISITVEDAHNGTAVLTPFVIDVKDLNDGPLTRDDHFTVNKNTSFALDVLANDAHLDGKELTINNVDTDTGTVSIVDGGKSLTLTVSEGTLGDVKLYYTVTDDADEALTSSAYVFIKIEDRQEGVTFESIGDVNVDAKGLWTDVSLDTPTATSSDGSALFVELRDGNTRLKPGTSSVYWDAINQHGEVVATQVQNIHVNPQVTLPISARVAGNVTMYAVEVNLNGALPSNIPSIEVPYTINGEQSEVVIINNEETTATIFVSDLHPDQTYNVHLDPLSFERPLNLGSNSQFELTVGSLEETVAPTVSSALVQNQETRSVVDASGGNVTLTIEVRNASLTPDYLFTLAELTETNTTGVFDLSISELEKIVSENGKGTLNVEVKDQSASDSVKATIDHQVFFEVVDSLPVLGDSDSDGDLIPDNEEGYGDNDGDGIADYLDSNYSATAVQLIVNDQDEYLAEVQPGLQLVASNGEGIISELSGEGAQGSHNGLYDFRVENLGSVGELVHLVLPQTIAIPEGAVYRKYRNGQWETFVDDALDIDASESLPNGTISSAKGEPGRCPTPGSPFVDGSPWNLGLNEGDWCIQLSIRDGGNNDDDGLENAVVVDPGAVTFAIGATAPSVNDDVYTVEYSDGIALDVLGNDIDIDGDQLIISGVKAARGDVSTDGTTLFFTPPEGELGTFEVKYIVQDTSNLALKTAGDVSINVVRPTSETTPIGGGGSSSSGASLGWFFTLTLLLIGCRRRYVA